MQPRQTVVLTPRQMEVVRLITLGETIQGAALKLHVSPKTVEFHWSKSREKIGINSPVQMVHYAMRAGLIKNIFGKDRFRIHVPGSIPFDLVKT